MKLHEQRGAQRERSRVLDSAVGKKSPSRKWQGAEKHTGTKKCCSTGGGLHGWPVTSMPLMMQVTDHYTLCMVTSKEGKNHTHTHTSPNKQDAGTLTCQLGESSCTTKTTDLKDELVQGGCCRAVE